MASGAWDTTEGLLASAGSELLQDDDGAEQLPQSPPCNPPIPPEFIHAMPKTDIHVHLDGSVRIATVIELAKAHNIELPAYSEEGLRETVFKSHYEVGGGGESGKGAGGLRRGGFPSTASGSAIESNPSCTNTRCRALRSICRDSST